MEDGQSVHTPQTKRTRIMTRHPERSAKRAVVDQGGSEDFLAYTDKISFPRGISPLRSDRRPHFGRNDIIKPSVHRRHFERQSRNPLRKERNETYLRQPICRWRLACREIPCNRNENNRTRLLRILARRGSLPRQPTRLWRLATEKSPAVETITIAYVMRRDEGVPPYRRLRPP